MNALRCYVKTARYRFQSCRRRWPIEPAPQALSSSLSSVRFQTGSCSAFWMLSAETPPLGMAPLSKPRSQNPFFRIRLLRCMQEIPLYLRSGCCRRRPAAFLSPPRPRSRRTHRRGGSESLIHRQDQNPFSGRRQRIFAMGEWGLFAQHQSTPLRFRRMDPASRVLQSLP